MILVLLEANSESRKAWMKVVGSLGKERREREKERPTPA